jgi:hypothetical protein
MPLFSRIPTVAPALQRKAEMIVAKTAFDVQRGAQVRSRVDTGQMKSGWRVGGSGTEMTVENSVRHTVFNEFGTRYKRAQPMIVPAVEAARANFYNAVRQVFR